MNQRPPQSHALRRYALIFYWVAMFVGTHWPKIEKYAPDELWLIPHADKLIHATLYAGWVSVWWWLLSAGGTHLSAAATNWLIAGGVAYAILDESTQLIVGRTPDVKDWTADVVGILAAVTILQTWQRRRARHQTR